MPTFVMRDIPGDAWARFRERAEREHWHLRALFGTFVDEYGAGRLYIPGQAPRTPATGVQIMDCPKGHRAEISLSKDDVPAVLSARHLACPVCGTSMPLSPQELDVLSSWERSLDQP